MKKDVIQDQDGVSGATFLGNTRNRETVHVCVKQHQSPGATRHMYMRDASNSYKPQIHPVSL